MVDALPPGPVSLGEEVLPATPGALPPLLDWASAAADPAMDGTPDNDGLELRRMSKQGGRPPTAGSRRASCGGWAGTRSSPRAGRASCNCWSTLRMPFRNGVRKWGTQRRHCWSTSTAEVGTTPEAP